MEDRYYKRAQHPHAGRVFVVKRGNFRGQSFHLRDWAVNCYDVPTHILNVDGIDLVVGTIAGRERVLYPDQLDTPLFAVPVNVECVVPDPEC